MKLKLVAALIIAQLASSATRAEWRVLAAPDGHVVEVAVDFDIEDLRIDPGGDVTFSARTTKDDDEIGFAAALSRPRKTARAEPEETQDQLVLRSDVSLRSIGTATVSLERILGQQFARQGSARNLRFAGLYSATCPAEFSSVAHLAVFYAMSAGITFDDNNQTITGEGYAVMLVVDGSMKRMTAYISAPAGYGGTPERSRLRQEWYKLRRNDPD